MIRKIFAVLAILITIGMLAPAVFAETDSNIVDANTQEEIRALNAPYGAEVRLLQLEKSISRNILFGAKTIEIIEANHPGEDTNELSIVLDELEALLLEVQEYSIEGKDSNVLALDFVAFKKEAINFTQEFKTITVDILTVEDKQEIHDSMSAIDGTLGNMNQAIKQVIRMHNAQRVRTLMESMGINNPELIQSIEDGNVTKQFVKEQMRQGYETLGPQQKKEAWFGLKEKATKRVVADRALAEKVKMNVSQKLMEVKEMRQQRLEKWLEQKQDLNNPKIMGAYEKRAERINQWSKKMIQIGQKISNGMGQNVKGKGVK